MMSEETVISPEQNDSRRLLVCIVTGEPSGDLLGARLMAALRRLTGDHVDFMGIGGESMQAEGLVSMVDQRDLAVMGFIEVLPKIPTILRHVRRLTEAVVKRQPDVLITVDSWGFTKRVHRSVRKATQQAGRPIPQVHYVAPMVWAWKEKRARDVAATVDRLLCLLPNEPDYFTRHGLKAVHVGHPVIEGGADRGDASRFCSAHGIASDAPVLVVLPGSRKSEIQRLLPVFGETVQKVHETCPGLRVVLPTVATVAEAVQAYTKSWPGTPVLVRGEQARYDAFAAAQAALAASGTVSLELAMARVPHLVAYRVAPLTAWIYRRLSHVRYINLINHTIDRLVVPEILQEECTAPTLTACIQELRTDEAVRQTQVEAFDEAMTCLGGGEGRPSERAAAEILDAVHWG